MRFANTMILILAALAAAGGFLWTQMAEPVEPAVVGEPLIRFDAADLGRIDMERGEEKGVLRPVNQVWKLVEPVDDRLDTRAALTLFMGLNGLELRRTLEGVDLEEFGLGRRGVRVALRDHDGGLMHELTLGHVSPWEDDEDLPTMYVQWHDGPQPQAVHVVGGNLRTLLDRPFESLRARQALHLPQPPLRIEIARGHAVIELARGHANAPWRIVRPLDERADGDAVAHLLESLSTMEAAELTAWEETTFPVENVVRLRILTRAGSGGRDSDVEGEGEEEETVAVVPSFPERTPEVEYRVGPPLVDAAFARPPRENRGSGNATGKVVARFSDRRHDLWLDEHVMELLSLDPNEFRSRTLGDLDPATLERIVLRDELGNTRLISMEDGRWLVSRHDGWERADALAVRDAVGAVNTTPVIGFPDDAPQDVSVFGFDFPVLQAAFVFRDGSIRRLSFARDEEGLAYARFDDRPSVYQVPEESPQMLPLSVAHWRSRRLFDFPAMDVRQILLRESGRPEVALRYNPMDNLWVAFADGEDRSSDLDPAAAAILAAGLEGLTAAAWVTDGTSEALAALAEPTFDLVITVVGLEDDGSEAEPRRLRLRLAALPDDPRGLLVGRIDNQPETFLIREASLDILKLDWFPEED